MFSDLINKVKKRAENPPKQLEEPNEMKESEEVHDLLTGFAEPLLKFDIFCPEDVTRQSPKPLTSVL